MTKIQHKLETLTGVVGAFVEYPDFGNIFSFANFSYLPGQTKYQL